MAIRTLTIVTAATLALLGAHQPARAGIADSPLPELEAGQTTFHVYSVPAVIRSGGLGTFFGCTSTDINTIRVGVELFFTAGGAPANDAVATSLNVAPGAMVIFGTSSAVGISIDSNVGFGSSRGSARILATSRKLACSVWVADSGNAPPTSAWQLTIIAKTKQKAAN